jgi:hypothetical protein|tara:strand:+ start:308 stop:646 length:339 start_codon:yes stop_codon:yes gene_type:complete
MKPTITMMQLVRERQQDNGYTLLARFTFEDHHFEFTNCGLLRAPNGNVTVALPKSRGKTSIVRYTDRDALFDLIEMATGKYEALGGDKTKDEGKRSIYEVPLPPAIQRAERG